MSGYTDEDLLDMLTRQNRHAAFAQLVERHAVKFRNLAFRFVGTRHDAEDIVQEAFIKLWNKPNLWKSGKKAKFTTWFYRVIINQCMDHKRRGNKVMMLIDKDYIDSAETQEAALEEKQTQMGIEKAFNSLPKNMQASLNLSFYEAVSNKEAADVMGISLKAFQSLLMRAKAALREKIIAGEYKKSGVI